MKTSKKFIHILKRPLKGLLVKRPMRLDPDKKKVIHTGKIYSKFKKNVEQFKKELYSDNPSLSKLLGTDLAKQTLQIATVIGAGQTFYPLALSTIHVVTEGVDFIRQFALGPQPDILSQELLEIIEDYEERVRQIVLAMDHTTDKIQVVRTISDRFYTQYWLINPGDEPVEVTFELFKNLIGNGIFDSQGQKTMESEVKDIKIFNARVKVGVAVAATAVFLNLTGPNITNIMGLLMQYWS